MTSPAADESNAGFPGRANTEGHERELAASALAWWSEAGVDTLVDESPRNWLKPKAAPSPVAAPEAVPAVGALPDALPDTLDAFRSWLAHRAAALSHRSARGWSPPAIPLAGLMVMTDMPAPGGGWFEGEADPLFDRMMTAIGQSRDRLYLAPLSPARTMSMRFEPRERAYLARARPPSYRAGSPRALLLFGDMCAQALLGEGVARTRGRWHDGGNPCRPGPRAGHHPPRAGGPPARLPEDRLGGSADADGGTDDMKTPSRPARRRDRARRLARRSPRTATCRRRERRRAPFAIPAQLSPSEREQYQLIFADLRASNWASAAGRLDGMRPGALHDLARAMLYTMPGSPPVELAPLMQLLERARDLPQAGDLARLAARARRDQRAGHPPAAALAGLSGQPRRVRPRPIRGDRAADALEPLINPLLVADQPREAEAIFAARSADLTPEARTAFQQRHRLGLFPQRL